jgi:hypothetical protein
MKKHSGIAMPDAAAREQKEVWIMPGIGSNPTHKHKTGGFNSHTDQ